MGSPEDEAERRKDEGPVHAVRLSDFWISTLEIPWDVYELFVYRTADSPAENQGEVTLEIDGISGATMPYVNYNKPGYPAINITQYAASQFCKWLTAKTGHYYRLPTEAEWEYACRAGSEDAFYFGTTSKSIASYALYKGNSDGKLHKGGMKEPNALGLYDMHGNVAEWVIDRYNRNGYPHHTDMVTDPLQLGEELYPRVVRGGSYKDKPARLRSAARGYSKRSWKKRDPQSPKSLWWHTDAIHVGFRIVRPRALPAQSELIKYWIEPIKEY
jgi:formylglycine-generating enzyme required for sulfatase activity